MCVCVCECVCKKNLGRLTRLWLKAEQVRTLPSFVQSIYILIFFSNASLYMLYICPYPIYAIYMPLSTHIYIYIILLYAPIQPHIYG